MRAHRAAGPGCRVNGTAGHPSFSSSFWSRMASRSCDQLQSGYRVDMVTVPRPKRMGSSETFVTT